MRVFYWLAVLFMLDWCWAENEKESNLGEVLLGDEKVHLYYVTGSLAPSNWSYFDLKWEGRLRIILDSPEGDADLYLSYNVKRPGVNVNEHDMVSATCGLDIVDIPQFSKRPIHLGVYGHPSKPYSSYRMLLVMMEKSDSEFEVQIDVPPEIIHSFGTDDEMIASATTLRETIWMVVKFLVEVLVEVML